MTAPSELFCNETVRDASEETFSLPKYHRIGIQSNWKGIWHESEFPDKGILEYFDDNDDSVARVHFDVAFEVSNSPVGRYIEAFPKNLVLELPNGEEFYAEDTVIKNLEEVNGTLRKLCDKRTFHKDDEIEILINNHFNNIVFQIDTLIMDIKGILHGSN